MDARGEMLECQGIIRWRRLSEKFRMSIDLLWSNQEERRKEKRQGEGMIGENEIPENRRREGKRRGKETRREGKRVEKERG
jgi:hypothetical protein